MNSKFDEKLFSEMTKAFEQSIEKFDEIADIIADGLVAGDAVPPYVVVAGYMDKIYLMEVDRLMEKFFAKVIEKFGEEVHAVKVKEFTELANKMAGPLPMIAKQDIPKDKLN